MGELPLNINIEEPRWDQSTFLGRARHFFTVTDPRNLLLSGAQLEASRNIVQNYRAGVLTPGLTEDQLWRAKYVYDSAFHPDTGEKVVLIGRMSAQVPMNMTITGCMLTFYRTTPTVVFWQWVNQSFNAIVNYSNRSGDAPITVGQLGTAYVSATTGAVATALGLKSLTKHLPPLVGRFVPFAAVAAANCINIPLMRQRELQVGIPVTDETGQRLGHSVTAAKQGIFQVVVSRICMAIPAMAIPPVIMDTLEKKDFLKRRPWLGAPLQVGLVGFCLVFATPLCCALFPQRRDLIASPGTDPPGDSEVSPHTGIFTRSKPVGGACGSLSSPTSFSGGSAFFPVLRGQELLWEAASLPLAWPHPLQGLHSALIKIEHKTQPSSLPHYSLNGKIKGFSPEPWLSLVTVSISCPCLGFQDRMKPPS